MRLRSRIRISHGKDSDYLCILDEDGGCELPPSISANTRDDLSNWHEYLTKHWHPDTGWSGDRWWFADEAHRLQDALNSESSIGLSFEVDDWPAIGTVKLMSDYMADWPLWGRMGLTELEDWQMLSEQLLQRLQAWDETFQSSYRVENGWTTHRLATWYANEGERLARDLADELGQTWRVDYVNWT